jgi:hypothetical protein
MKTSYFSINEEGVSIRSKFYGTDARTYKRIVIFSHGFGGHKDNKSAEKFAEKILSKYKDIAVISFDWPCHGEDAIKQLALSDCDKYLGLVIEYAKKTYSAEELYSYATSFGGYLVLKYIHEHGNPFASVALRCAAVKMYDVINSHMITEDDRRLLSKGKPIMLGFDKKIKITNAFLEDLKSHDLSDYDFGDDADNIILIQGTKDEVVSPDMVSDFADDKNILYISVEGADHRFTDPLKMDLAIKYILEFFDLS